MTLTFEQIYKKYYKVTFNYIRTSIKDTMIAEELTSDVMIRVHKSLDSYNEDLSSLSTWMRTIARNLVVDHFRKKHLDTIPLENVYVEWANGEEEARPDHLMYLASSESNPEERMISDDLSRRMYKKFESLNNLEKTIASLHFFDGLSYEEVSQELSIPLGTVKAKLHRARQVMMEAMPKELRKLQTA
jgi:RNA polymerase sigma factor (sigma-70 family)